MSDSTAPHLSIRSVAASESDKEIVAALGRCALGDPAALRVIHNSEARTMTGVAMRILRRRELAEEAVQDAFLKIFTHANRFDPMRGEAKSWIYAILRNRAFDILRGETRTDLVGDFQMDLTSPDETPEASVSRLSDARLLNLALEKLESTHRKAVVLSFISGLTHAEVASKLGVPIGTAKSWIRRSLVDLRADIA